MAIDKKKGTEIILGTLACGAVMILGAYRKRQLRRLKGQTRFAMDQTRVGSYDAEDRAKVRKILRKYGKKVYKARRKGTVYRAERAFDRSMEGFRTTAEKLTDAKLDAVKDLYSYGTQKLGDAGAELAGDYMKKIKAAGKTEVVSEVMKQFRKDAKAEAKKQGRSS